MYEDAMIINRSLFMDYISSSFADESHLKNRNYFACDGHCVLRVSIVFCVTYGHKVHKVGTKNTKLSIITFPTLI